MKFSSALVAFWFSFIFFAGASFASELSDRLSTLVKKSLEEKIPTAEIKIPSLEKMVQSVAFSVFDQLSSVRLIEEKENGLALFEVKGFDQAKNEITKTIQTPFEAWVKVPVATHRIYPNTKLKNEDFKIENLNVATGPSKPYRSAMVPADTNFNATESKQSILAGQFVVTNAIHKQPDLRRGDSIKLELISGDLSLTTQGIAQEPASTGDRIRVITVKTKKEIMGVVRPDHSVEVSL